MFTYADGARVPFDPRVAGSHLAGCILCGRRVQDVGVFMPTTDDMRMAIAKLRNHPQPERSTSGIAYGLCKRHARDLDGSLPKVEAAIFKAAAEVTVQ